MCQTLMPAKAKLDEEPRFVAHRYELLSLFGRGMSEVWLALDCKNKRLVVLKCLPPEPAWTDLDVRLQHEARIVEHLASPLLPSLQDAGDDAAIGPFIVVDYVPGFPLSSWLTSVDRIPAFEAAFVAHQVAQALAHCHAMGVVHRDVKPANVILGTSAIGRATVRLIDLGIARRIGNDDFQTPDRGLRLGTPGYMAPEQIFAVEPISQSADVWGLGVLLYKMLTGAGPFTGMSDAETIERTLSLAPKDIGNHCGPSAIPSRLAKLVMTCLAKSPEDRPQSLVACIEALEPWAKRADHSWFVNHSLLLEGVSPADVSMSTTTEVEPSIEVYCEG